MKEISSAVHKVLPESEEDAAPFWTGTIKDGTPGGDTPSLLNLLRKVLDVKRKYPLFSEILCAVNRCDL